MNRKVHIATTLSANGVRGWVKLHWHGEDPLRAAAYKTLFDKSGRAFEIAEQRMQGKTLAVKFTGIDDRTAAEKLRGTELFLPRAALPAVAEGEYYHIDLIGLAAAAPDGEHIGIVKSIQNFGAGDVLEVGKLDNSSEFYPFDAVQNVDFDGETIVIVQPKYDE